MAGSLRPLLGEGVADRLDDPALDLARGAERVDHAADVVDRGDALDGHLARLDVDGDLGDLHAEGQDAQPRRVRAAGARAEDLPVSEQPEQLAERLAPPVREDDRSAGEREPGGIDAVALRREIEDLLPGVTGRGANRRPHRGNRRRAGRQRRIRAANRVADRDGHVRERDPELLGRDLGERRLHAGADVLSGSDHGRVAVRADADPGVARRPAAAPPDLRGEPDSALHRVGRAGAHLVAALPVRLGAAVALEQVLARVLAPLTRLGVGVVAAAQLERVELRASPRARRAGIRARTSPPRSRAPGTPSSAAG